MHAAPATRKTKSSISGALRRGRRRRRRASSASAAGSRRVWPSSGGFTPKPELAGPGRPRPRSRRRPTARWPAPRPTTGRRPSSRSDQSSQGSCCGRPSSSTTQLGLRVDRVLPVGERELEELRLGDGLGGAGLHAEVAVDAAQVVDLVDEAVALAGRHRVVGRVVGAADVDAPGRAHAGAQLAADALLHAVLVPVEDVAAVEALGLLALRARSPSRRAR